MRLKKFWGRGDKVLRSPQVRAKAFAVVRRKQELRPAAERRELQQQLHQQQLARERKQLVDAS